METKASVVVYIIRHFLHASKRRRPFWSLMLLAPFASTTLLAISHAASPTSIGVNFGGFDVTGTAGVLDGPFDYRQANWNNTTGKTGTASSLLNSAGVTTGTQVTWQSDNTFSTNIGSSDQNSLLMKGYIDNGAQHDITVTVSNIPFSNYDVVIYFDGLTDDLHEWRVYNYRLLAGPVPTLFGSQYALDPYPAPPGGTTNFDGTWIRATGISDQGTSTPLGNYAIFSGVTGDTFQLIGHPSSSEFSQKRAPVNAIQVFAPEPGSILLVTFSITWLASNRRRVCKSPK